MTTDSGLQQDTGTTLPQALPDPFPDANTDTASLATPDLVCDCRRMLRYAGKNGMTLAQQLVNDIAKLDAILVARRMAPVSDVAEALVAPWSEAADAGGGDAGQATPGPVNAQVLLLMVHQDLSALIAPATALTLAVSEPSPGKHRLMGGVPLVVKSAALVAVVCALTFMTSAHLLATADNAAAGTALDAAMSGAGFDGMVLLALHIFSGAALGAAFYVLVKTQPYLVKRSYDPRYNAVYIARFITGVIGGVILATALGPALKQALASIPGIALSSSGVLAILGGYAAEAVESILQRIVEVMLAAIRGDGSDQAQAKMTATQAETRAAVENILPDLRDASGDPAKVQAAIQKIRTVLKNS